MSQNSDFATSEPELKFYLSLYDQLNSLDSTFEADYIERAYKKLKRAIAGFAG